MFTWTPTEAQGYGTYTFDVKVIDDGTPNLSDSETITVTVNEVNVAPVLGAIGNQTVDEQVELTFTATATDADLAADGLTFSLAGSVPAGASITSDGVFTWTPTEAQGYGTYMFDVEVTDDGTPNLSDSETITVTVNPVNDAPTDIDLSTETIVENTDTSSGHAVGILSGNDPDTGGPFGTLTFTIQGGADAGKFGVDGSNNLILTDGVLDFESPTDANGDGVYEVTIRVTDGGTPGLTYDEAFTVSVTDVNETPTDIDFSGETIAENTDTSGGHAVGILSGTDPDTVAPFNTLIFTIQAGSDSGKFSVDGANNLILTDGVLDYESPTDANGDGVYEVTIQVTDGGTPGLTYAESFGIAVTDVSGAWIIDPSIWISSGLTLIRNGNMLHLYETGTTNDVVMMRGVNDTSDIAMTGRAGEDDALTVDFSGGDPIPSGGVSYEGGEGGNDSLVLTGGSPTDMIYSFSNESDGSVQVDGSTITYTGLEPINSTITAANVMLDYSSASETIVIANSAVAGQTSVDSTAGEVVTFNNPSGSLTINAGGGDDTINLVSLQASYPAHISINGPAGSDTLNVNGEISLDNRDLSVMADMINLAGPVDTGGGRFS